MNHSDFDPATPETTIRTGTPTPGGDGHAESGEDSGDSYLDRLSRIEARFDRLSRRMEAHLRHCPASVSQDGQDAPPTD